MLSLLGPVGCDANEAGTEPPGARDLCPDAHDLAPSDLIPADATEVLSIDVAAFDTVMPTLYPAEGEGWWAPLSDAMARCGLRGGVEQIAVAEGLGADDSFTVYQGKGIGDASAQRCILRRISTHPGAVTTERSGCSAMLLHQGEPVAMFVGPDMLVQAFGKWLDHARAVSLGAKPTPPEALLENVEPAKRRAWAVAATASGDEDEEDAYGLPLPAELRHYGFSIDGSDRITLRVEGSYATRQAAAAAMDELQIEGRRAKRLAPHFGLPPKLAARAVSKRHGRTVTVTLSLSVREFRRFGTPLRRLFERLHGGR